MTQEKRHVGGQGHKQKRDWHRDWRAWVVVGLMLAAMFAHVLSDDESLQPGGGPPQQAVPAEAGPLKSIQPSVLPVARLFQATQTSHFSGFMRIFLLT